MKIKTIVLLLVIVFAATCGSIYYYFFQPVTDYYTIMFTPYNIPLAQVFGQESKLAQPELKIRKEQIHDFKNDEEAVEWLKYFAESWKEDCLEEAKTNKDRRLVLEKEATCQFMLMSFTHTRNFDVEKLKKELIKKHSLIDFQKYCYDNDISARFYLIDE